MKNKARRWSPVSLLVLPALLGTTILAGSRSLAEDPKSVVFDYADQITRLVESRKIDELAKLDIPATDKRLSKLQTWTSQYVTQIQKQEAERDKQFQEEVAKAQDLLKKEKFDGAMNRVVRAYQITKDQEGFLKLEWVKDLTAKVAAQALELEKKGHWLESLELYSNLSSLYEIDTRYKPDMQRLGRRIRLLAMYTPKTLYAMRKELAARQKPDLEDPATAPATQKVDEEPTNFPRWQDYTEKIVPDMMRDAIEHSRNDWVEKTSYETLLKGGLDALRLFLTTPELSKEFPGLGDKAAIKAFDESLNGALATATAGGKEPAIDDIYKVVEGLIQTSSNTIKLPEQVLIMEFTDGAMEKLDPFTAVIWPHEKAEFEKNTKGSFGGVGIQISLENGQLTVISPLEDTPAFRAGIMAGDIISAINGKTTVNMSIDQAVHTITGEPKTEVVLTIKRAGSPDKEYRLIRDVIRVASVKGFQRNSDDTSRWDFMIDPENKIGYIRLTGFQDDTAQELKDTLGDLQKQGMRGLVLDLRFNPGGLLNSAIDISDMFLTDGVIVSTRGRVGARGARANIWKAHMATEIPNTMPVVVLVNQYSASASEILAGALKDLHRALIVGHRTFGKGSVQNLLKIGSEPLPGASPDAMMKLTMAYYYLPKGESLHRKDGARSWGVDPDVLVDITPKQLNDLIKGRRDAEIIHRAGEVVATQPATKEAPAPDTQLETAMLMMRLQLVQSAP